MAKYRLRIKARDLRRQGYSLNEITTKLGIAKSSASRWCRDIKLSKKAIARLTKRQEMGSYLGRIKGAKIQQQRRLQKIKKFEEKGRQDIKKLGKQNFLIAGAIFYWGEGNKKENRIQFSNSDPEAIRFMMRWFKKICKVEQDRFILLVNINQIHKNRIKKVEEYWSNITKIPLDQFSKTSLIKAKNKKVYKNFEQHFGTLCIRIKKSANLQYQIMGWIKALISSKK